MNFKKKRKSWGLWQLQQRVSCLRSKLLPEWFSNLHFLPHSSPPRKTSPAALTEQSTLEHSLLLPLQLQLVSPFPNPSPLRCAICEPPQQKYLSLSPNHYFNHASPKSSICSTRKTLGPTVTIKNNPSMVPLP